MKNDHRSSDLNKDGRIGWKELDVKDKISYVTAISAFALGWLLIIAGFCVPPLGLISGSVLSAFGSALLYCASVFGISLYFSAKDLVYSTKIEGLEKLVRKRLKSDDNDEE